MQYRSFFTSDRKKAIFKDRGVNARVKLGLNIIISETKRILMEMYQTTGDHTGFTHTYPHPSCQMSTCMHIYIIPPFLKWIYNRIFLTH